MRRLGATGFTLPELLISLGMLGVVLSATVGTVLNAQRGYVRQREVARAEDALRVAETTVGSILRAAGANPRNITGVNAPRLVSDATFDNLGVVSDFNPPDGDTNDPLENVFLQTRNDTLYVRWRAASQGGSDAHVAYPVRSLKFAYYRSNGTLIGAASAVDSATRVKVTLVAPRHSRTSALAGREMWIYLRNRRS
jgi:prepilin-type N-terminal cleavage/methylation domain-containing protein